MFHDVIWKIEIWFEMDTEQTRLFQWKRFHVVEHREGIDSVIVLPATPGNMPPLVDF